MNVILVLTNLPDRDSAEKLAGRLVEKREAACVNILAPCISIYHWQGKTESAQEVPLLIKTTEERYAALEQTIRALHPYELPEIIHVPVTGGLPDYLNWVSEETSSSCCAS
jgi:periplasmic divalent cation tolerance protein